MQTHTHPAPITAGQLRFHINKETNGQHAHRANKQEGMLNLHIAVLREDLGQC